MPFWLKECYSDMYSTMYVSVYPSLKVWGFAVVQDETRLVTGCSDSELRVWKISSTENDTSESTKDIEKQNSKRSAEEAGLHDEAQEDAAEVSSNHRPPLPGVFLGFFHL